MSIESQAIDGDRVTAVLEMQEGHFVDLKAIEVSPAKITRAVSVPTRRAASYSSESTKR
jgi:hypothetical protein